MTESVPSAFLQMILFCTKVSQATSKRHLKPW